jgi:serine/threonine protein kinase
MESLTLEDPPSIGGYELRARLGEGGFGLVYLGLSPGGRAVAVKVLQREFARDAEFLRRFRLEVAAAQQVNGIYTAPVVAAGMDERPPWVATAFVPGPPLDQVVAKHGPLPEPALWRLLAGLVEALQAIHACGLVHRDLKPGNVMLAADGPRVIDFGISKALDGTAMTSTGAVFGTPAFMAPEQAEGREIGPATDVFALGCVLAYAATGVLPFGGGSAATVLYRIVHGEPDLGGMPPRLRGVVERCLAKGPVARPRLAELAGIGRDGPGGAAGWQSPASFWPPHVGKLIRDYQDRLDIAVTARIPGHAPAGPASQPPLNAPTGPTGRPPRHARADSAVQSPGYAPQPPGYRTQPPAQPSQQPGSQGQPAAAQWQPQAPAWQQPAQPQPWQQAPAPTPWQPGPAGQHPPQAWQQPGPPRHLVTGASASRVPGTVSAAFIFMIVGAGLAFVSALAIAFNAPIAYETGGTLLLVSRSYYGWSWADKTPGILCYLIACGTWAAVALAARLGQGWARVAGTFCLGIFVLLMALYGSGYLSVGDTGVDLALRTLGGLLALLIGIAGLASVVLLWSPPSAQYFRHRQHLRARRAGGGISWHAG